MTSRRWRAAAVLAIILITATISSVVAPGVDATNHRQALYVTSNAANVPSGDDNPVAELEAIGFEVILADDDTVTAADADTVELVVISTSVSPTKIGSMFTDVAVPILTWERALYDDLGLTTGASGTAGEQGNQRRLDIVAPTHPIAVDAGLTGTVTVATSSTNFSWGAPSPDGVIVAQVAGRLNRPAIFTYEPGDQMGNGIAPARRVAFFPSYSTPRFWNAAGAALFRAAAEYAADAAAAVNRAPTVTVGPDETILIGETADMTATVTDDGLPDPPAAFTVQWTGPAGVTFSDDTALDPTVTFPGAGDFDLTLTADDGELTGADTVTVTVRDPSVVRNALFITKSDTPPTTDQPVVARLEGLGFTVIPADDNDATPADAAAADIVLISSSISPNTLDDAIGDVAVPMIVWEARVFDDLGWTRSGGRSGEATNKRIKVVSNGHDIVGDLVGNVTVYTSNSKVSWGRPEGEVEFVATMTNSPIKSPIFTYDTGAQTWNGVAAARRVGFFLGVSGAPLLTDDGWDLFDNAVAWALDGDPAPVPDAGPDASIPVGDPLTLAGSVTDNGSNNPPGVTTTWTGPPEATFGDPSALDSTVTFSAEGTFTLTLTANDGQKTGVDTVDITVDPNPLSASFTATPNPVGQGVQVDFDGSASSDPGGGVVSWAWSFGDGATATGETVDHTYGAPGLYTVTLVVTDTAGLTAQTTVDVTVLGPPPTAVALANTLSLPAPGIVNFDGTSSTAPGASISTYAWDFGDGSTGSGPQPSHVYAADGVYPVLLTVTSSDGRTAMDRIVVRVNNPLPSRVTSNLIAFYDFTDTPGSTVADTSGVLPALDLTIDDPNKVTWFPRGGIRLDDDTVLTSAPANRLNNAIETSGEFTVEAWIDPAVFAGTEPGRIVAISENSSSRNLGVSQGFIGDPGNRIEGRIVTSQTTDQGFPAAETPAGSLGEDLVHVVYTRNPSGLEEIYLNGILSDQAHIGGDLSPWTEDFQLALGADPGGTRAWLGDYHLVAIYDRALTHAEICQNMGAGPGRTTTLDNVPAKPCLLIDQRRGDAPLMVNLDGSMSVDHDGVITGFQWNFGDGTVLFDPVLSFTYPAGDYNLFLTVWDDDGVLSNIKVPVVSRAPYTLPPRPAGHDAARGMRASGGLFDREEFDNAELWLGAQINWTVQFTEDQGPIFMALNAETMMTGANADLPALANRLDLSITVPLGFGNANARTAAGRNQISTNLANTIAGTYDARYQQVAQALVAGGYDDAVIRIAHEFNGVWPPYSSRTNEPAFIAAWQHVHDIFEAESANFRFEWNSTRTSWGPWGMQAYPGDAYVDVISMDVYWNVEPGQASWNGVKWQEDFVDEMQDHLDFAIAHGKPVAYPEWGLIGADEPRFIEGMYEWFAGLPATGPGSLLYQSYFDAGSSKERLADHPLSKDVYIELFGPPPGP